MTTHIFDPDNPRTTSQHRSEAVSDSSPSASSASKPPSSSLSDPWDDWKPKWTIENSRAKRQRRPKPAQTPHDFQECHSPTQANKMKISSARQMVQNQRRIVDARLWNRMSPTQQDAALAIEHGFQLVTKGIGYRTSDPARIPHGKTHGNSSEYQSEIIDRYFKWAQACQTQHIQHAPIIDILAYGHSCRQCDKNRRVRNGWARQNLLDGLSVYCAMRGWPV